MGVFQACIMEAMQSLTDEFKTIKKSSEAGMDQISALDPKPGTSKQNDDLPPHRNIEPNTELNILCGPALPPNFCGNVQSKLRSDQIRIPNTTSNRNLFVRLRQRSIQTKENVRFRLNIFLSHLLRRNLNPETVHVKKSSKPKRAPSDQDKQQTDPDPVFC